MPSAHVTSPPQLPCSTPISYANDLDIAPDGRIFFTDCSDIPPALNAAGFYDTMRSFVLTMLRVRGQWWRQVKLHKNKIEFMNDERKKSKGNFIG